MPLQIYPNRLSNEILRIMILVGAVAGVAASPAHAQSLDSQVKFYLENQCFNLRFPNGALAFGLAPFVGPLVAICGAPQGTASTSGGGGASSQGSTLSIQNSLVQQRLERARRKKSGDKGASAVASLYSGRSGSAYRERSAATDSSGSPSSPRRFDIFASGGYENVDRKVTAFEDGYESSVLSGAVGADYQFNDLVVAGLVLGYRQHKGDFNGGGDFDMKSFEPSIYVSVLPSQRTFLQFVAGYGGQNSDVNRHTHFDVASDPVFVVDGLAASSADAKAYNGSAQFGFDQPEGRFTFGPRIGVYYSRTTIDPYTETGATGLELRVAERTVKSVEGVIGFYGSAAWSTKSAVVIPQLTVNYIHEFEDKASIASAQFAGDDRGIDAVNFNYQTTVPDADFMNVEGGVVTVFPKGIQLFVNLHTMIGNANFNTFGGTIGLRFEL